MIMGYVDPRTGIDYTVNKDLAGQKVQQGDYTVTYNENGQVKGAVRDNGRSSDDYDSRFRETVGSSADHQAAYDAAKSGDWDKAASYINNLTMQGATLRADGTSYDVDADKAAAANEYWRHLTEEFDYNPRKYYGVDDDDDDDNGGYSGGSSGSSGSTGLSVTEGAAANGMSVQDYTEYLKQQHAAQIESALANLKSAYETSMNGYSDSMERLPEKYATGRNNVAAQDAIARQGFDERAVASGLSSGARAQAELARENVYRSNIAAIDAAEGSAKADIQLQMNNLEKEYQNAIVKAKADGNASLANALYQELVRVQNVNLQQQATAQQQANWEAQFGFQQQQYEDALAQQQREWEFTQQQYADAQNAMAYEWQRKYGTPYPGTSGIATLPSAPSLSAASTISTQNDTPRKALSSYDNGGLSASQIIAMQNYYGATPDGMWGKNSASAAGGLTAAQAWQKYQAAQAPKAATPMTGGFSALAYETIINRDGFDAANAYLASVKGSMTDADKTRAQLVAKKYA